MDPETNSFNGMIGMVQRNEVHMAMGGITATEIRDVAVDFTYPYFVDAVGIMSRHTFYVLFSSFQFLGSICLLSFFLQGDTSR